MLLDCNDEYATAVIALNHDQATFNSGFTIDDSSPRK
jgi:hypothetical protein